MPSDPSELDKSYKIMTREFEGISREVSRLDSRVDDLVRAIRHLTLAAIVLNIIVAVEMGLVFWLVHRK